MVLGYLHLRNYANAKAEFPWETHQEWYHYTIKCFLFLKKLQTSLLQRSVQQKWKATYSIFIYILVSVWHVFSSVGLSCRLGLTKKKPRSESQVSVAFTSSRTICREQLDECLFTRSCRPQVKNSWQWFWFKYNSSCKTIFKNYID